MNYDRELGKITDQDRKYAAHLLSELKHLETLENKLKLVAEWFRKVRYEAVIADRAGSDAARK